MWKIFKKIINWRKIEQNENNGYILIVEENLPDRQSLCQILTREHFIPVVAKKNTLIEMAENTDPCLIILKSVISGKKTLDLCANLKTSRKTSYIPVIIIAEKDDNSNVLEYYLHNADCFLIKPISKKELISQVKTLIYKH